jgi:hypothetical protein
MSYCTVPGSFCSDPHVVICELSVSAEGVGIPPNEKKKKAGSFAERMIPFRYCVPRHGTDHGCKERTVRLENFRSQKEHYQKCVLLDLAPHSNRHTDHAYSTVLYSIAPSMRARCKGKRYTYLPSTPHNTWSSAPLSMALRLCYTWLSRFVLEDETCIAFEWIALITLVIILDWSWRR